jgi:uncharacterized surface protein with fasciclin (FAS1) repeats
MYCERAPRSGCQNRRRSEAMRLKTQIACGPMLDETGPDRHVPEEHFDDLKEKDMRTILFAVLFSIVVCGMAAAQTRTNPSLKDLIDKIRAEGNHKIFLDLIETAGQGFPTGFRSHGQNTSAPSTTNYTIFAPTDGAFAKWPADVIQKLKSDPKSLQRFLRAHILARKLMIADMLVPAKENPAKTVLEVVSLDGAKVSIFCNGHSGEHHPRINNVARIEKGDILFSGGVIHEVDAVLTPHPGGAN